MLALLASLAMAAAADAADPVVNAPLTTKATINDGQLKVNTKLDLDVGTMSPAPQITDIAVNPDGTFSAPANKLSFPTQVMQVDTPIGKKDIFIDILAASPVTGTIDPDGGAMHIETSLMIHLTSNDSIVALGNNCYVGSPSSPIAFSADAAADDSKGVHYDQYTGEATVVDDTLAIPAASGCPTIFGNNINDTVNGEMGLPSPSGQNVVTFELRLKPAPHGEDWVDPNGPGHIDPVIVNDTETETYPGLNQAGWLESLTIGDNKMGNAGSNRATITLLVKHNPDRTVTALRIDDDWNASEDAESKTPVSVVPDRLLVAGGHNYSRVTYSWDAPTDGMNLTCPGLLGAVGTMSRNAPISVLAAFDDGSESEVAETTIRLAREDCNNHRDNPFMFGQTNPTPSGQLTPGDTVTFKFKMDDSDGNTATYPNRSGGYIWRWRNLDTGKTTTPIDKCISGNQDNIEQTVTTQVPNRGRWVMEAELMSHPYLIGDQSCIFDGNPDDSSWNARGHWFRIGAVDVNSPQQIGANKSPDATLNVPARPEADGSLPISVNVSDQFDLNPGPNANQGKVQTIEWDLDDDVNNGVDGFETVRLGDFRDGMGPGQNQVLLDTTGMTPGNHIVRVRVTDNGALSAADPSRRQTIAQASFLVNTPPTAQDLTVETDYGKSVATTLVTGDVNGDPLTWSLVTPPAHGYLSGEWPNRTYHPNAGFSGEDSYVFKVDDGFGGTAEGTVTITVKPQTTTPVDPTDPVDPDNPDLAPLKATFPEGRMNLNEAAGPSTSGVKVVDSAIGDAPVVFDTEGWNQKTGQINAPGSDLVFPAKEVTMSVTDPIPLNLEVNIELGAIGPITGNFNPANGRMRLNVNAHALINITTGGGQAQVMSCDITPLPLTLESNGATLVDPGEPAENRPAKDWKASDFKLASRDGAVTSLWNSLPASTPLSEPMAPLATCAGTLDDMIGGKGGIWLGGKVTISDPSGGDKPNTNPPNNVTGIFDGKRLHIRLKCGPQYRPKCNMRAFPVTGKGKKGKVMAKNKIFKRIKSGKWVKVSFLIKPKFRKNLLNMAKTPNRKRLFVRMKVKSKKIGKKKFKGKARTIHHKYKVRTAG